MARTFNRAGPDASAADAKGRPGVETPNVAVRRVAGRAAQAGTARKLAGLQSLADASPVVQRTLYPNPNYAPTGATLGHFTALDANVAAAETNAANAVTTHGGGVDTPKQVNWKKHPNSTTWGYVVEEQLDIFARGLGWDTQYVLPNARPDYMKTVGGVDLFADLTTLGQSGAGGAHVGGKLARAISAGAVGGTWHAADIVHSGAQPGAAPSPIVPNGRVTQEQEDEFARFKAAIVEGGYDEWLNQMLRYCPRTLSHGDFYSAYNFGQRQEFVDISDRIDNEEEDDSSMEYSLDSDEERL